jgi:hypothetical protein
MITAGEPSVLVCNSSEAWLAVDFAHAQSNWVAELYAVSLRSELVSETGRPISHTRILAFCVLVSVQPRKVDLVTADASSHFMGCLEYGPR